MPLLLSLTSASVFDKHEGRWQPAHYSQCPENPTWRIKVHLPRPSPLRSQPPSRGPFDDQAWQLLLAAVRVPTALMLIVNRTSLLAAIYERSEIQIDAQPQSHYEPQTIGSCGVQRLLSSMPERPEVEACRYLPEEHCTNKRGSDVHICDDDGERFMWAPGTRDSRTYSLFFTTPL